jgi:internalin A
MTEKPAKRRSSLTLLEVGVILVIAAALGTFVMHRATEARRRAVAGALKAAGAKIKYGEAGAVRAIDMTAMPEDQIQLTDIALLTALTAINLDHSETLDEHLLDLSGLKQLTKLHLVGTGITDEGCRHLASHPAMRFLDVRADFVSDAGLAHLGKLKELVELRLAQTWITDDGLKSLAGLQKLESLDLRHTDITDAGLKHLHSLENLRMVRLIHSRVTEQSVKDLQKAMPELAVEFNPDRSGPNHLRVRMRPPKYSTERDEIGRVHVSERALLKDLVALEKTIIDGPTPPEQNAREILYFERGGFLIDIGVAMKKPPADLIPRLPFCRNLERLGLAIFRPDEDAFSNIHRLRFLRNLAIICPLTDRHLADISRLPNLTLLVIEGTHLRPSEFSDEGLKSIANLSHLTNLEFARSNITDEGLRHLTAEKLPLLSSIRLSDVPNVTREGVFHLLDEFPLTRKYSYWIRGDEMISKWESEYRVLNRKRRLSKPKPGLTIPPG